MKYTVYFGGTIDFDEIINLTTINTEHILRIKPYDAILKLSKILTFPDSEKYLTKEMILAGKISISQIYPSTNEYMRLVEVDNRLIPLIESTDNNHFYRNLFFDSVFINSDFKYNEFLIKGLYAADMSGKHKSISIGDGSFYSPQKNWFIMSLVYNTKTKSSMFIFCELVHTEFKEPKEYSGLINHLRNILCNIVDLVEGNIEDVGIRTISPTEEQREKRKERGKVPIPTKIFIIPKELFLKYISDFHNNMKLGHKFLIRGHWRHFRNFKYSEFKRLNPTWIKPYFKGEGIIIKKPYVLKHNINY